MNRPGRWRARLRRLVPTVAGLVALTFLTVAATAYAQPRRSTGGSALQIIWPPGEHVPIVKQAQYHSPIIWTWKCAPASDGSPLTATLRWEIDERPVPNSGKGGNGQYAFTSRAKSFAVKVSAPCGAPHLVKVVRPLPQTARLKVWMSGNVAPGKGILSVSLRGGFKNAKGEIATFHLGVTLAQSGRTLLDGKFCAWSQTGFVLAKGPGTPCWW